VVDDAARTITFRLSRPDPAFLHELALPFGSAVPAGSPPIGATKRPLPATGPYVIEHYVAGHVVVLRRNARFRAWSSAAQPAGFPERIVLELGLDPAHQAGAVAADTADVAVESPPSSMLERLSRRVPLQLHANPLPEIGAMFLNTRTEPFDRAAVRQALGLAVDRSVVVHLWGGPRLAKVTCQILPQSFPGYRPFCPSTARPNAAGVWHAPDLTRARRLIAGSGTAGMRVTVSTVASKPAKLATGRYFVDLLRSLGYRARLRVYADDHAYYDDVGLKTSGAQIGFVGWIADYPSGSAFFQPIFSCASYRPSTSPNLNAAGFCHESVDREIVAATELELTNPAAANVAWGTSRPRNHGDHSLDSTLQSRRRRLPLRPGRQLPAQPGIRRPARPALGQVADGRRPVRTCAP
jgi:peptide/nickel transport system substrate-binding protein